MIVIINGPNLNLLGKRSTHIYGTRTLPEIIKVVRESFPEVSIMDFQSNSEGAIIDLIHQFGFDPKCDGIVINPGAYAHYSLAIADAIESVSVPVVEVHISNIHAREEFRHNSVTARAATAVIAGCGTFGYKLAVEHLLNLDEDIPF